MAKGGGNGIVMLMLFLNIRAMGAVAGLLGYQHFQEGKMAKFGKSSKAKLIGLSTANLNKKT